MFTLFLVGHWSKYAKNGNIWPKMTKNADFQPNLAVFGQKILILWSAMGSNGPKMPIFGKKRVNFGPNLAINGPKILIFMGVSKSFGTHTTEKSSRQLVQIVFWSGIGSNGPKQPIYGQESPFLAKFGCLLAKNPNFYGSK